MMMHGADEQKPPQVPQQYSASQPQPTTSAEEEEVRTLRIDGLYDWIDEYFIREFFYPYVGTEVNSKIISNKKTGKSKCYAFIEFPSHAIAERILRITNGIDFPWEIGPKIRLNWASISCFGSGGEIEQQQNQEDDDDDDLAASDMGTTDCMLQQEEEDTFTTHRQGHATPTRGVPVRYMYLDGAPLYPEEAKQRSDSVWEDMLQYWRNIDQTTRPVAIVEIIRLRNVSGPPQFFRDLAEKKESKTVDVAHRVSEIANFFGVPIFLWEKIGIASTKFEDLLDELQGYAGSIDVANALHSIDRLLDFAENLDSYHAGIRARVAEVLTTMIQYHPRSQQLIMEEANCGPLLIRNSYADPDETSRINALGAISALIWNNVPGITGFRLKDVYSTLRHALLSEDDGFQRKALNLLHHLLHENNSECNKVAELGLPHILMDLAFRDVAEVRQASLRCLLVLVRVEEGGNNGQLVKNDDKLKLFLRQLMAVIDAMDSEDLGARREERQLVDSLWNALRDKGLLKLLEPPPRHCPVAEAVEENCVAERKEFLMRKLLKKTLLLKRRKLC